VASLRSQGECVESGSLRTIEGSGTDVIPVDESEWREIIEEGDKCECHICQLMIQDGARECVIATIY
jgi:hypothetical protein